MSVRSKVPTARGTLPPAPPDDQKTSVFDSGNFKKEAVTPIKAISMKTPGDAADDARREQAAARPVHQVKLRAISEVAPQSRTKPQDLGNLAPRRDSFAARARRTHDYVIWGCAAVILASIVALVIWLVAR